MSEQHKVILVDGSGYIFRAYYALPPMTDPQNTPVNAVFGFFKMMLKLRQDYDGFCVIVVFDSARRNFRNEIYPHYKANRSDPPEDLVPQFALIRDAVKALSLPAIEVENFEADDIIASLAAHARHAGREVVIVSSDKDLMQLVGDGVSLYDPMKNRTVGIKEVEERFGVAPERVIDVQALAGDSSDNIPGALGIGVKTAAALINEYGSLDALLERADEIKQPKRRENLTAFRHHAEVSRQLVTLRRDVPEMDRVDFASMPALDTALASGFITAHGFHSLAHYFADDGGTGSRQAAEESAPIIIRDAAGFHGMLAELTMQGMVALDMRMGADGKLCGVGLAPDAQQGYYLPLGHIRQEGETPPAQGDLLRSDARQASKTLQGGQMNWAAGVSLLAGLMRDDAIIKITYDGKFLWHLCQDEGIHVTAAADVMLMSFVLDAGLQAQDWESLCVNNLPEGGGAKDETSDFAAHAIETAAGFAARKARQSFALYQILLARLCVEGMAALYQTLELPLIPILGAMERTGIALDKRHLQNLSAEMASTLDILQEEIFRTTGEEFNIGSPKQLGEVLFDRLKLPHSGKTKTGQYSTDNDVLDRLVIDGHEIAGKIQHWRHVSKLRSTYTEALPKLVAADGRLHTRFSMVGAQTGRLSSVDPNLQNIPVRDALGKQIRESFIAPEGKILLSLDYSQIELRLLAHIAGLDALTCAFAKGEDIHRFTAAQVFETPLDAVTPAQRRSAKAVNFGIIYGISPFGLARQLMIDQRQAKAYIDAYLERYQGLKRYMEDTVKTAKTQKYVTTAFGRKIHLPGIEDKNPAKRNHAKRQAVNAPIQGSAADIIKYAMLTIADAVAAQDLPVRLLLQVHDELVFEADAERADAAAEILRRLMTQPGEMIAVPLVVDIGKGKNWAEAH